MFLEKNSHKVLNNIIVSIFVENEVLLIHEHLNEICQ